MTIKGSRKIFEFDENLICRRTRMNYIRVSKMSNCTAVSMRILPTWHRGTTYVDKLGSPRLVIDDSPPHDDDGAIVRMIINIWCRVSAIFAGILRWCAWVSSTACSSACCLRGAWRDDQFVSLQVEAGEFVLYKNSTVLNVDWKQWRVCRHKGGFATMRLTFVRMWRVITGSRSRLAWALSESWWLEYLRR